RRLLRCHPDLHDVEEELQQVLVLGVPALYRKREKRSAALERERRRKGHPGSLPRFDHVVRSILGAGDEALGSLAQSHTSTSGDYRRHPATAGSDRYHSARLVRGLDRRGPRVILARTGRIR